MHQTEHNLSAVPRATKVDFFSAVPRAIKADFFSETGEKRTTPSCSDFADERSLSFGEAQPPPLWPMGCVGCH